MSDRLTEDDVKWVVNDLGELGVKIGEQFFWLYKGKSLVYEGLHEDGTPMLWRLVGKREFGEVCHPIDWWEKQFGLAPRYTRECVANSLTFDSDRVNPEYEWQPLPNSRPDREPASNSLSEAQ